MIDILVFVVVVLLCLYFGFLFVYALVDLCMWNDFRKKKPKEKGWYLCTIDVGSQRYVMDLWWDTERGIFKDNRRLNVFQLYEVYGYGYAYDNPDPYLERMYKDNLCDRTDEVVAWRNVSKCYMRGFKGGIHWNEKTMDKVFACTDKSVNTKDWNNIQKDASLGEYEGYIDDPCPKCGRVRVEAWSCGKHICEKCHWCIEDGTYYLED